MEECVLFYLSQNPSLIFLDNPWDKIDTISLKIKMCKLISRNIYAREHDCNECICALPNQRTIIFKSSWIRILTT